MQASNKIVKIKTKKSYEYTPKIDHKRINKHDRKFKRNLKRLFE